MFKRILAAVDGSEPSWRAFDVALDLASKYGGTLHALTVEENLPHYAATVGEVDEERAEENGKASKMKQLAENRAKGLGVELHFKALPGHEVKTILEYTSQGKFDLLVVGRVGHSGIFMKHTGSTSTMLTFHSPCSVLVVH